MPYYLEDNEIKRLPSDEQILHDYEPGYFKGRRYNLRKDGEKVLTDDVVNWSKDLGDQGIFMQNINDGPVVIKHNNTISFDANTPVNEFISQPGFTDKVKFIEGNTGDFDINNPYKYSYIPTEQQDRLNITALGGPLMQLANKYEEGGPYKPGTIYGRPTEEGLKTVSPEFDALLIGKVAANAAREAAGELLNSGIEGTARQRAAITSRRFGREMAKRRDEVNGWSRTLLDDVKDGNYADIPLDLKGLTRNVWETGRYIKNTPERYVENTLPKFYRNVFRRTYNNTKPAIPMVFSDPENNE